MDWATLYREPYMMSHILQAFRENGLPEEVPIMVTESHIAASLVGPMSTIYATLWLADSIGSFFEAGGAAYYHSPIQPQTVSPNSPLGPASWSNFVADRDYNITGYTAPVLGRPHDQLRMGGAPLRHAPDVSRRRPISRTRMATCW